MKSFYQTVLGMVFVSTVVLLTDGCSSTEDSFANGGIEGTGDKVAAPVSASGSVTGFGSIWVNGIRFDVSNAVISNGDQIISEQAVQPGMVVHIEGTVDADGNAQAKTVKLDEALRGPVTEIIRTGYPYSEIRVLGQTVLIPEEVVLNGVTTNAIKVGDNLIVNGLKGVDGSTLATRIEKAEASDTVKLEGTITSVDGVLRLVTLGESQVDYSSARFVNGSASQLTLGKKLQVEAVTPVAPGPNPTLVATLIRFTPTGSRPESGSRSFQEGVIAEYISAASFSLNGLAVDASLSSVSRGSLSSLASGVRISAEGKLNSQGVFVAEKIKVLLPSETRYNGTVEAISITSRQITVLGTTFTTDSHTAYEDLSSRGYRKINLNDFSAGDSVEIFGRKVGSEWFATRIRRVNVSDGSSSLRGPVGEILSSTQFYIMGILVDASAVVDSDFGDDLKTGRWLIVQGTLTGDNAMKATRITKFEHDHCPAEVQNTCDDDEPEEDRSKSSEDSRHHGSSNKGR